MKKLFHVTNFQALEQIKVEGIKPQLEPSGLNQGGMDPRKHKGSIYAFGRLGDTLQWAHRLAWNEELPDTYIITFNDEEEGWEKDEHFENHQGFWLHKPTVIHPDQFENIELFQKECLKTECWDLEYKGQLYRRFE